MSPLLAPPTTEAQARSWLPGPAYAVPEAVCPDCGSFDGLVYSVGGAYVCCLACGWQRRLSTAAQKLDAALAISLPHLWPALLVNLALTARDPLPPVPALLWRRVTATTWEGPSAHTPDTEYTVTQYASGHVHCDCPHFGKGCWHRRRCAELGLVDQTSADGLY